MFLFTRMFKNLDGTPSELYEIYSYYRPRYRPIVKKIYMEDGKYIKEQYKKDLRNNARLIHRRTKEGWERVTE